MPAQAFLFRPLPSRHMSGSSGRQKSATPKVQTGADTRGVTPANLARNGDPIGLTAEAGGFARPEPRSHDRGHRSWPALPGGDQRELSNSPPFGTIPTRTSCPNLIGRPTERDTRSQSSSAARCWHIRSQILPTHPPKKYFDWRIVAGVWRESIERIRQNLLVGIALPRVSARGRTRRRSPRPDRGHPPYRKSPRAQDPPAQPELQTATLPPLRTRGRGKHRAASARFSDGMTAAILDLQSCVHN